jgi:hypothetical protein
MQGSARYRPNARRRDGPAESDPNAFYQQSCLYRLAGEEIKTTHGVRKGGEWRRGRSSSGGAQSRGCEPDGISQALNRFSRPHFDNARPIQGFSPVFHLVVLKLRSFGLSQLAPPVLELRSFDRRTRKPPSVQDNLKRADTYMAPPDTDSVGTSRLGVGLTGGSIPPPLSPPLYCDAPTVQCIGFFPPVPGPRRQPAIRKHTSRPISTTQIVNIRKNKLQDFQLWYNNIVNFRQYYIPIA